MTMERGKYLYAFDFDHTIIHDNSDTAITSVVDHPIPDDVEAVYNGTNWTEFMNHIFRYLASQGVTLNEILDNIKDLKFTPGMPNLLQALSESIQGNTGSKLLIISDANDVFIKTSLSNLNPPVVASGIITNPSVISEEKPYIQITPYENQQTCPICPKNLCKGSALRKYIEEHGPFTKIFYAGDGANDLCPALILGATDTVFVRQGYRLAKLIKEGTYKGREISIAAQVVHFENASTITDNMVF